MKEYSTAGGAGDRHEVGAAAERDPLVEMRGLRLGYGRRTVLEEVNLTVRGGEFWAFLGPNGEGKTTLVKAILGALRPSEGTIGLAAEFSVARRIGFVPQRCEVKRTLPMTVGDFVLLGLVGMKLHPREEAESLAWALDTVGLSERAREDYWSLSGGQRQRALVARALVRRPPLLILDEPTSGLDIAAEEALLGLLARLHREEAITLILVTHDVSFAARLATHAALFRGGSVIAGRVEEVLTQSRLGEVYGVDVAVEADGDGRPFVRVKGNGRLQ